MTAQQSRRVKTVFEIVGFVVAQERRMTAAKALGLTVPPTLLARADEVIE